MTETLSAAPTPSDATALQHLLRGLQQARDEELATAVCREICHSLGFAKAGFSWVHGSLWIPAEIYIPDDDTGTYDELRQAVDGTSSVPLYRAPSEAALVRSRKPYVLRRSAYKRAAYLPIIELSDPAEYAAAPILANGRTVGMLHVDRDEDGIGDSDLQLLLSATNVIGLVVATRENLRLVARRRAALLGMIGEFDQPSTLSGNVFRDPAVTAAVTAPRTRSVVDDLSSRELEILRLLSTGATNRKIADDLYISEGTVKTHVRSVFRKLNVSSRSQAAAAFRSVRATTDVLP